MAEGVEVGRAYVTILPSASQFGPMLQQQMGQAGGQGGVAFAQGFHRDSAGRLRDGTNKFVKESAAPFVTGGQAAGKGFGGGVLASAGKFVGPLAALFTVQAIGSFFKEANDEARESQKVNAITANAVKVTGGAAHVTAQQVGDLATAISNKTGVDDEAIQTGANLLLTFKNVRNEAGKNNDVFNQATAAAADLSAAGFGSIEGSSKMLGKALNDPIKGISALGRAGVTFTAQQKEQIKALVQSGDTLGAQKIILGEVQTQVGGAAAASATSAEKLTTKWNNFKELIGTALLPILDRAFDGVGKVVTFVSDKLAPVVNTLNPGVTKLANAMDGAGSSADGFAAVLKPVGSFFTDVLLPGLTTVGGALSRFGAVLGPILAQLGAKLAPLAPQVQQVFGTIGAIIGGVLQLVGAIINRFATNATIVWNLYGAKIMSVVSTAFSFILGIIGPVLKIIQGIIKVVTSVIKGDWQGAWDGIKMIVGSAIQLVQNIITRGAALIKAVFGLLGSVLKNLAVAAWNAITTTISNAWNRAVASGVAFGVRIKAAVVNSFQLMKTAASVKLNEFIELVKSLPGRAVDAIGSLGTRLYESGRALIQGLVDGVLSKIQAVKDAAGGIAQSIKDFFPGSPVAEGPLVSWNNGGAGKRLGDQLAAGLIGSTGVVGRASEQLAGAVSGPSAGGVGGVGTTSGSSSAAGRSGRISGRLTVNGLDAYLDGVLEDAATTAGGLR